MVCSAVFWRLRLNGKTRIYAEYFARKSDQATASRGLDVGSVDFADVLGGEQRCLELVARIARAQLRRSHAGFRPRICARYDFGRGRVARFSRVAGGRIWASALATHQPRRLGHAVCGRTSRARCAAELRKNSNKSDTNTRNFVSHDAGMVLSSARYRQRRSAPNRAFHVSFRPFHARRKRLTV